MDRPPPPPDVADGDSTAGHALSAPEWWQLGAFAEPARRGPFLWKRAAKKADAADEARAIRESYKDYLARAREANTVRA